MTNDIFLNNEPKRTDTEIRQMSPLVLAYIGDTVWDLAVRRQLIEQSNEHVHQLHCKATKMVCASAQAELVRWLEGKLNDEEQGYVRRGRNAKASTMPKNANPADYRLATGFESMLGALYIGHKWERLNTIITMCLKHISE